MSLHPTVECVGQMMVALIHEATAGPLDDNRRENCVAFHGALRHAINHATDAWANGILSADDKEVLLLLDQTFGSTVANLRQTLADLRA